MTARKRKTLSTSSIPKDNKIEVYLLTSAEDLYEYLAEESEGFKLIAMKRK